MYDACPGPIYSPYAKCLCDLDRDDEGEYTLPRAEESGKAVWVLNMDGFERTSPHLRECKRFAVTYPVKYDPTTIARDILRATGSHLYLPALNQHWNEKLAGELNAIVRINEGHSDGPALYEQASRRQY